MLIKLRKYLVTGMVVTLPLVVTVYILVFLFNTIDGILRHFLVLLFRRPVPGAGFVAIFFLVLIVGVVSTNVFGKKIIAHGERFVTKIPLVKNVYISVKQIIDAFSGQGKHAFQRVVMVEHPRPGMHAIGFVTSEAPGEVKDRLGRDCFSVFLPTTPNPASGFLRILPRKDITFLDMSVEEGLKLIISCGAVVPQQSSNLNPSAAFAAEQAAAASAPTPAVNRFAETGAHSNTAVD